MQMFKKLNRILDRRTKIKLVILFVLIIIGASLEMAALAVISPFLAILFDNAMIETNQFARFAFEFFDFTNIESFLAFLLFLLAGIYIFRGLYSYVLNRVQARFLFRCTTRLSAHLLGKILGYPYQYHAGKNVAELQTIILSDNNQLFGMIAAFLTLLVNLFKAVFILAFLLFVSPIMTSGVLGLSGLFAFIYYKFFRKEIVIVGERRREMSIEMSKSVLQAMGGVKEIKLLRREGYFVDFFKKFAHAFIKANTRFKALNILPNFIIESVFYGGTFVVVGILILGGADMAALLPIIGTFIVAASRIFPTISAQINQFNAMINSRVSVDAVYKNLFEEDSITDLIPPETELPSNASDIIVSNVTFKYPKGKSPVLKEVSLTIPYKKSVAFVGPSGMGKTTLADVILGILIPESGGVFHEGKSVHHYFDEWARNVGYIPQFIYLIDDSILNNVAFGIKTSDIDMNQVWYALEQAQLADFVRSLPDGIDTEVGDRGVRLSGGQRQRVGIARALYNNPSILVLDEATSSLDTETEAAVMEAIEKFQGEKTLIIIAHRLSTIENCDIIYRVEDGNVVKNNK